MADGTATLERVSIKWLNPRLSRDDEAGEPRSDAFVSEPRAQPPLRVEAPLFAPPAKRASFLARLRGAARRSAVAAPPSDVAAAPAGTVALDPLTVRQRLYGRGYIIPGDAAWLFELVAPFRLNASSSVLDLAAGLGGPARSLAQAFHSRITGLERDYERAQQGNAISTALGAAHLVRIRPCDPEALELDAARFDCALGREASYAVAEKERFLRVVAQSLRARGQIVLTDFALDRAAGERDELGAWHDGLARRPSLWTAAQYADCFKSLGFALRRADDISALYRRQIVAAWTGYLRAGDIRGLPPAQVEAVLAEAEASHRTVAALESGALKYYRFEAIAHYSFW